ncbi:hypothetical protein TI39_contig354g00128 [Zymoseptoria brevis]|uniref:Chromo domain-containing protein n=1 Tax=Zymoseptoria brevis TaxID=1047168 RepID=A0A0F4GTM7_9PEZI|nr:hypothetical protein TI39_contig354g00128 [Zymoseptoria brevis]
MAKRKRLSSPGSRRIKRNTSTAGPSKHPHGQIDPDKEYKVRDIIGETKTKYHVDWEDDSETGEQYVPTWEPKDHVNELAVESWIRKQAAKSEQTGAKGKSTPQKSPAKTVLKETPAPAQSTPRRRPKRVIDSSPTDNISSVAANEDPIAGARANEAEAEIVIGESQQTQGAAAAAQSPLFEPSLVTPAESPVVKPVRLLSVQLSDPPSSFRAGAYERLDDHDSSTEVPTQSSTHEPGTEQSRTVPDSQSQGFESTFQGFSPVSTSEDIAARQPQASSADSLIAAEDEEIDQIQVAGAEIEQPKGEASTREAEDPSGPLDESLPGPQNGAEDSQTGIGVDPVTVGAQLRSSRSSRSPLFVPSRGLNGSQTQSQDLVSGRLSDSEQDESDRARSSRPSATRVLEASRASASELSLQAAQAFETPSAAQQTSSLKDRSQPKLGQQQSSSHQQESGARTQHSTTEQPQVTSEIERITVHSSTENPSSQFTFLTQPNYDPPPAGQQPLPEYSSRPESAGSQVSAINERSQSVLQDLRTPAEDISRGSNTALGSTQSSFSFQTQLPQPPRTPLLAGLRGEQGSATKALKSPIDFMPASRARSTPSRESSAVPSIPPYSLGTVGESAPAALTTPSQSLRQSSLRASMEPSSARSTQALVEARIKEKKAARQASRMQTPTIGSVRGSEPASALPANISAEVAASQAARLSSPGLTDGGRSPSAVPAVEAVPSVTKEQMNTSGRYGTLLPQALQNDFDLAGRSSNGAPVNSTSSNLNSTSHADKNSEAANVHVLPVPLGSHQRDQYINCVFYREELITSFLGRDPATSEDSAAAELFLDELRDIAMHPDLANDETMSQQSSLERQAQWDLDISSKFRFLRDFLESLQSITNLKVIVAAKGFKLPAMVSNFLQGLSIAHTRLAEHTNVQASQNQGHMTISVLDLDLDIDVEHITPADVVIAMDGSVDFQDRLLQAARRHTGEDRWAPLIKLAVPHTVEHIERCLSSSMTAAYRLRVLVKNAKRFRSLAGKSDEDYTPAKEVATAVVAMLKSTNATEWPFAELGPIEDLDSQTDTESSGSAKQQEETAAAVNKRPLEIDVEMSTDESTKRLRTQLSVDDAHLSATINPHDVDITHVSDSIAQGTQSLETSSSGGVGTQREFHEVLSEVQNRLEEYTKALEDLQYRHEDQRALLVKTQKELEDALTVAQAAVQRRTLVDNQNAELRVERSTLKQQLEDANKKLLDHANPERREFEALRLQLEDALSARAKAEKRTEATLKDLQWTREVYQDSSSKASELGQQNIELESKLAEAQSLASGEAARARQISQQGHNKLLEKENEKLRLLLEDRNAGLKFRDEEIARLKEAARGRMGTRGSSVPRSPRVESPLKGRTSRHTSPAAGDVRSRGAHLHPLRNG